MAADDLLTAREVQDLLKIDRTTVYRMLKDGRLDGVKVGQQWRFPRREVDALLSGARPAPDPADGAERAQLLPVHCIQAIQDLFAELAGVAAVTLAPDGAPITQPSGDPARHELLAGGGCVQAAVELGGRRVATLVAAPGPDGPARAQLAAWARSAARSFEVIGRERAAFADRLRRIAALTDIEG